MAIAAVVAVVSSAALLLLEFGPGNNLEGSGDGMITASVLSRAGVISIPSEPPAHLVAPQTVVCTENLIRVDDVMESPKLAE
jgi:NAD(P)H-hydrate repair Nnr-like enzyme with NAD(P)H-hydrate epimerase domain